MHEPGTAVGLDKPTTYRTIVEQLQALIADEQDWIANLANTAALLYHTLENINWAGFYLLKGGELVLGPFQGKPACVRIAMGHGVCGTAAARRETIIVPNVHEFPGHIACDSASNAEIVVPMMRGPRLIGVLDIDSPRVARFDEADRAGLQAVVDALLSASIPP
jgi:GAF domain-containing protein